MVVDVVVVVVVVTVVVAMAMMVVVGNRIGGGCSGGCSGGSDRDCDCGGQRSDARWTDKKAELSGDTYSFNISQAAAFTAAALSRLTQLVFYHFALSLS